LTSHTHIRACA